MESKNNADNVIKNDKQVPISVLMDNFRKEITNAINSANLPICITEMILKDIYSEVKFVADKQLVADMQQ